MGGWGRKTDPLIGGSGASQARNALRRVASCGSRSRIAGVGEGGADEAEPGASESNAMIEAGVRCVAERVLSALAKVWRWVMLATRGEKRGEEGDACLVGTVSVVFTVSQLRSPLVLCNAARWGAASYGGAGES